MTGRHRARRRDLPPTTTLLVVAAAAAAITVPAVSTRMPHTLIVTAPAEQPWTLPATAGPARTHGAPVRTPGPLAPHTATPVGGWTARLYDAWQAGPGRTMPSAGVERPATVAAAADSPVPTTPAAPAPTSAAPGTTPAPTPDPTATTPAEPTTPAPSPDPTSPAPTTPPPTTEPGPSPTPTTEPTADPDCEHGKPRKCQP